MKRREGTPAATRETSTDEVIAEHIAQQNIDQDEDFRVDG
jgi:hypothetical protein